LLRKATAYWAGENYKESIDMEICRNCGHCCHETEMELTQKDIDNIKRATGLNPKEFAIHQDGYWCLRNKDNHCIFLEPENENKCKIYKSRPKGCEFYPMMYDIENDTCLLDRECPHRDKFFRKKKSFQTHCSRLKKWAKANFYL